MTGDTVEKETMVFGHLSDLEMAGKVRMLMRNDLDHEAVCTGSRDRIMYLSQQVAALAAQRDKAEGLAAVRLETIKAMSGYLDDVAGALGVKKPGTPGEGVGACWKVAEAIVQRNEALEWIAFASLGPADPESVGLLEKVKKIAREALAETV